MNAAHWHLVLNHIPVLGTLFGLLIFSYGWWVDSREVLRAALALLVVSGIAVYPVYETGHAAEQYVMELSGVTESAIESHEEAASTTYYLLLGLAVISLAGLVESYRSNSIPAWLLALVGLTGIIALGSVLRTADAGGRIHHPEIEMKQPPEAVDDHDHSH